MGAINRNRLVVGRYFVWLETWKLRKAVIGPSYFSFVAKRISLWMLGLPLLSVTGAALQWICGRPWIWGDPARFLRIHGVFLVLGAVIGLGLEFGPRSVQIYKNMVLVTQGYRVAWRLLLNRGTLVRVTPVAAQVTRLDFYSQGRAKPRMIRGCPFEAAKVVEWFQVAGIDVELKSG